MAALGGVHRGTHTQLIAYHPIGVWGTGSDDVGLIKSTKAPSGSTLQGILESCGGNDAACDFDFGAVRRGGGIDLKGTPLWTPRGRGRVLDPSRGWSGVDWAASRTSDLGSAVGVF